MKFINALVVKLVDTKDLKSLPIRECRFESGRGHHKKMARQKVNHGLGAIIGLLIVISFGALFGSILDWPMMILDYEAYMVETKKKAFDTVWLGIPISKKVGIYYSHLMFLIWIGLIINTIKEFKKYIKNKNK